MSDLNDLQINWVQIVFIWIMQLHHCQFIVIWSFLDGTKI